MTATPKVLIAAADAENAAPTSKYQASANGKGAWIDKFTARNHAASTQSLSVWLVPSGGVPDNTNLKKVKSFAVGEDYAFPEIVGQLLGPGDSIYWQASAAGSISGSSNGRELT